MATSNKLVPVAARLSVVLYRQETGLFNVVVVFCCFFFNISYLLLLGHVLVQNTHIHGDDVQLSPCFLVQVLACNSDSNSLAISVFV